jgi:hypothetical protein
VAVVLIAMAWSGTAAAQGWLADRDSAQGRGIRLGDFELHPGVGSEVGYTTNVFLGEAGRESAILRVAPHIFLSTLSGERDEGSQRKVSFRAGLSGAYKYWIMSDPAQDPDMSAAQDANLKLNLSRVVTLSFNERFQRSIDPFTDAVSPGSGGGQPVDPDRDKLTLGTQLGLQTPGGLLKGGLGYTFQLDHFESEQFRQNRNQAHTVNLSSGYQFLPKTAFFWNGSLRLHRWVDDSTPSAGVPERNDSTQLSTTAGINGGLTPKLGFTLGAGYSAGFFEDDNDFESVVGQAQLRWRLQPNVGFMLGYNRAYRSAFQGNFARTDQIRARGQILLVGALVLRLQTSLTFVDFGTDDDLAATGGSGRRNDTHLLTRLSGEYRFTDWFAVTGEVGYLQNFTDFVFVIPSSDPDAEPTTDAAKYNRFSAFVGVRAFL